MMPVVETKVEIDEKVKDKLKEIAFRLLLEGEDEVPEGTVVKWIREDRER